MRPSPFCFRSVTPNLLQGPRETLATIYWRRTGRGWVLPEEGGSVRSFGCYGHSPFLSFGPVESRNLRMVAGTLFVPIRSDTGHNGEA